MVLRDAPDPEKASALPDQAMHLCRGDELLARMGPEPEEYQRQLKRKQKNQAAAQRSRQRQIDKADALHQQHESLEKHNHALRKEIQALQAELAWWGGTLRLHERLCPMECAFLSAPGRPGPHGCVEQPDLFQTPASPPPAQHLSPALQPQDPPGLLASHLPSLSVDPAAVPAPPAQLSPGTVPPLSTACSSLLGASLEFSALLPSPPALTAPLQPLGWEHPTGGKLGSSPHSPLAPRGLARPQSGENTPAPALSTENWQGLGVGLRPCPLPAFPLPLPASTSNPVPGGGLAPNRLKKQP